MIVASRPAKPASASWVSPYLTTVRDADTALAFYQQAFGFEKRFSMPGPDGKTAHAELAWRDGMIMLAREGGPNN
jgi:PhnB protein